MNRNRGNRRNHRNIIQMNNANQNNHNYNEKEYTIQYTSFYNFTDERKIKLINYISDIKNNNDDFKNITDNFLFDNNSIVTRERLIWKIRNEDNGYYLKKVKFNTLIKLVLVILQYIYH